MDVNASALDHAASRISRYKPERYQRNVLKPLLMECRGFDSASVNYVLHCLPGTMNSKSAFFDHLIECMNPGAVVFGSTLLQGGIPRNWAAQRLMNFYNAKGIFSNQSDDLPDLDLALKQRFDEVQIDVIGSAALCAGRVR